MKQVTIATHWHRGRLLLGAESPCLSWTRSPASTAYCGNGARVYLPHLPGRSPARSVEGSAPREPKHASQTSFWRAPRRCRQDDVMEVMYPRCAGLDLAKDSLVACVRIHGRPVQQECRTFGMTTREPLALSAWLAEHGVTHVAMEATGSYWKA